MTDPYKQLLAAGTAVVADVFDTLGKLPPVLDTGLFAVKGYGNGFAGPAYTVTGESHQWSGSGDRAKLAAIDAMPPGVVPLWAGNGVQGVCCFGDLLATAMQARGCAGVVVDGGVRDLAFLRQCTMSVVARYRTPAQAIGRWRVTANQVPVAVRGGLQESITVYPGDAIIADDDGVIVVPQQMVESVVAKVIEWSQTEVSSRAEIQRGMPLLAALEKYGHL
jgi:4-hydroxy-4-methyl-2-oxoglutarate aldolase